MLYFLICSNIWLICFVAYCEYRMYKERKEQSDTLDEVYSILTSMEEEPKGEYVHDVHSYSKH